MAKTDAEAPSQTRRCPRCETTKHKSEFTSMGYCRPCARDYGRERAAKKGGWAAIKKKTDQEAPVAVEPAGQESREDRVTSMKQIADKLAAPVTERVTLPLDEQARRRVIARQLSAEILAVLNSGEQLTLVATRCGAGVLIDSIQIDTVLL